MSSFSFCHSLLKGAGWVEEQLGGLLLLAAVILVFIQIIIRAFGASLSGLYELATFLVVWAIFMTAGIGIQRNIHVRVDILPLICPPKLALTLQILSTLATAFISLVLCYSGYMLVEESLLFGDRTIGTISIPMWIPQLIMPIGGVLMLFHSIAHLIETLQKGPQRITLETEASTKSN